MMGDVSTRWNHSQSWRDRDDPPLLPNPNSFVRPSGKSIYNQRKDYGQSLLKPQSHFQHHVEHLLTVRLEQDVRSPRDCLARLKALEAQGRVWGQDLILQVKDQDLVLRDVESKEELDVYPLGSIQGCSALLDGCGYDSVLSISVQERSPPGTSVLLFQCEQPGAEALKSSLETLLKQWKEEQRSQYGHRSSLYLPPYAPSSSPASEQWAETPNPQLPEAPQHGPRSLDYSVPDPQHPPWSSPPAEATADSDRDVEVLNHVLSDLDQFVAQLKTALGLDNSTNQKKKKKRKALPSRDDYTDFFQKVKYALNLVGRTHQHMQEPSPPELLHLIFTALSFVLAQCPHPGLAPAVEAPLLLPEAVELLERTLNHTDYSTWKSLGSAWNKTRAEFPGSELVPGYVPVFSDGWLPPPLEQSPGSSHRDRPAQAAPLPAQDLVRVLYEFQGRNQQELSVGMGDTLQVLDQRRKWWLVQDSHGQKGYVPSNILEPLGAEQQGGYNHKQVSPPSLHPSSPPAEVTAWLQDKGFSRLTVRCLGVLTGQQLLHMSPEELRAVCPEEWRRLLFKLSPVRTSLGIGPRD
ncbi:epidermal growth factor receptor kinase substrate 8-like protein 3 [Colius striatus]|uniref:epidermal growth factor receptor kinase substrate 8-like protein 3 n=1 Tax=Colius striatus TaxID=57412 RepID=UPI002B1DAA9A|nr:epidermal growth factor receptor kinase substrate 8-like protein 3 [Colius striatus]